MADQRRVIRSGISSRTRSHYRDGEISEGTPQHHQADQADRAVTSQLDTSVQRVPEHPSVTQEEAHPSTSESGAKGVTDIVERINQLFIQRPSPNAVSQSITTPNPSTGSRRIGQPSRAIAGPGTGRRFTGRSDPIVKLLKVPSPSKEYLMQSNAPPIRQDIARPILVIMDLNGCLLDRGQNKGKRGQHRPFIQEFLTHCSKGSVTSMVWSSATPENVEGMSSFVFATQSQKPVAVWNRSSLRLSPEHYRLRVQVYKQLQWVWEDKDIAKAHPYAKSGGQWDQSNTVLIDDSEEKAAAQPHNQLLMPEYKKANDKMEMEQKFLFKAAEYLEEAAHYENVSSFIRACSFQQWIAGDKTGLANVAASAK